MGKRSGTPAAKRAQVAERRRQAIELRLAGATYEAIAVQMGYTSRAHAHMDITRALRKNAAALREVSEEMIELELARLDRIQLALWPKILAGDVPAAGIMLRLLDQRAKLLGLDAPIKHEVVTVDVLDAEIQRLDAELRRRASGQAAETAHPAGPARTPSSNGARPVP